MFYSAVLCGLAAIPAALAGQGPFLKALDDGSHVIGNDIWNITIGQTYGTKLYYKGKDIIGEAVGHYVSYNGGASNLNWTSVQVHSHTNDQLDVVFSATEGDFHWVIQPHLAGAYQYFVNRALPVLGEFRSLFRLDNTTFLNGKTDIKDGPLPPLSLIAEGTKVQDETWILPNGTYITKYDWAAFIRDQEYYGVYGPGYGSWYIYPGKDEYNGDQSKQELLVHRESSSGDVVQLNMLHGTHFMASSSDAFEVGKTWGPWLWYLNDGSIRDVTSRAKEEDKAFPYKWFKDSSYQSRGSVSGNLRLSDGRPAANAAVFLGDNHPNETTADMGRFNYYTTYANALGDFTFPNVRSGVYALQAWANGAPIGDVSTTYLQNDIEVQKGRQTRLWGLKWNTQKRKSIWRIGDMDRKSLGFKFGGAPHQHALVTQCPANFTFVPGKTHESEWCYGQSALGTWTVDFNLNKFEIPKNSAAVISVSLAGYSNGVSSNILVNGATVGNLTSADIPSDPCMYRSATTSGEWHYFEFPVDSGLLKAGSNEVAFQVTRTTQWHGFMWDAVLLEWAN
ncbi:polysaccharide lyase family 4, domain III-domain-containing protein [Xylogone sp. PMI_703]|nr:polysaccharide lyase family 4, domain III-domain-containing protein [Xylogone sp. PMI_703]